MQSMYIYETSNAVLTFSSVFRTIRSLSCTGTKFQSRLVTSLFTARKGTATRINDRRFKGKLIRTSRVTRAPHQPIRRGLFSAGNDVSRVEMGVKSPRRRYLAVCVPRTGCNGAIITRRTIVCVDKKEGEEVETASS